MMVPPPLQLVRLSQTSAYSSSCLYSGPGRGRGLLPISDCEGFFEAAQRCYRFH